MLSRAIKYLEEKHTCPHCKEELKLCHAPPVHVGDGLGWGSEFLFICLNDECSLFKKGWKYIEDQYGHSGSYRYMEIPGSAETYNMMVAGSAAFKGSEVDIEAIKKQNASYQQKKDALAALDTCVEKKDLQSVLAVLLNEHVKLEDRKKAAALIVPLNDINCIEPIRNFNFKDTFIEQDVNLALSKLLANNFIKECPYCTELIKSRATVCKHCNKEL